MSNTVRRSAEWLEGYLAKRKQAKAPTAAPESVPGLDAGPKAKRTSKRSSTPPTGQEKDDARNPMNRLEQRYALYLKARKQHGEILDYGFGRIVLRLAYRTFYHCDFDLLMTDGTIQIHETKGYMRDDAAVKVKTAADRFPHMRFYVVRDEGKSTFNWERMPSTAIAQTDVIHARRREALIKELAHYVDSDMPFTFTPASGKKGWQIKHQPEKT